VNDGKGNVTLYPFPTLPIGAACGSYGAGAPGAGGATPSLKCSAAPLIGASAFGFRVEQGAAGQPAFLFASAVPASVPFGSTFTLLVDPGAVVLTGLGAFDGDGVATFDVPLPDSPALSGVHAFVQGFALDAAAEIGVSASQGLEVQIL
jgi:hypothetical protein